MFRYKLAALVVASLLPMGCASSKSSESLTEMAPQRPSLFPRPNVALPKIPPGEFVITDYGAVADGTMSNAKAIADTIAACEKAGGGPVGSPREEMIA
jgi:hypothetical protein